MARIDNESIGPEDASELRREVLLTRVIDAEATDSEWDEFRALADRLGPSRSAEIWRELAQAQRDHALLSAAVGAELAKAEAVTLPRVRPRLVGAGAATDGGGFGGRRLGWAAAGLGWMAVAATIAIAWYNGWTTPKNTMPPNTQFSGFQTGEEALQHYITRGKQAGTVVGEEPARQIVTYRIKPGEPGVYEVFYVRRIIERAEVRDMYRFSQDEAGAPVPVRVGPTMQNVPMRSPSGI